MMQRRFGSQMKAKAATVLLLVLLVCHALSAECGEVWGSGGRRLDFEIQGRGGAGEVSLECAGQTFAEVVLKAITAGAVNHWGLAAMGRCRIASRTAPHPHRRPAVPRYRR
ncbi:uncharacterized protein LOC119320465 [Triticum dicoccoides]|uniref:uncharacterized protein LOC119320465 n=1 Tax=Triticum dicoccoides TaxID=85692 RepID=UPI001890FF10|nr:uncharacterized protein LOC119320465 [Triticum dicoccoides]